MFEPEVFREQCAVLTKVLVALLGLFGARGIMPSCPLSLRPCTEMLNQIVISEQNVKFSFVLKNDSVACALLSKIPANSSERRKDFF